MTVTEEAPVAQGTGQPATGSVFWAWVHGEDVRAAFMSSVIATLTSEHAALVGSFFDLPSGPHLSLARNLCAEAFLESGKEWLLFIDSDTVFAPYMLTHLLSDADPVERPIISAAVPIARGRSQGGYFGIPEVGWSAFNEGPDGALEMISARVPLAPHHRVAAVGTGFLLIHRSVLEAIGDGPFNEESNGKFVCGEDISFCRRATALGFPIHVAGQVRVGHAKVVTLLCGTARSAGARPSRRIWPGARTAERSERCPGPTATRYPTRAKRFRHPRYPTRAKRFRRRPSRRPRPR